MNLKEQETETAARLQFEIKRTGVISGTLTDLVTKKYFHWYKKGKNRVEIQRFEKPYIVATSLIDALEQLDMVRNQPQMD